MLFGPLIDLWSCMLVCGSIATEIGLFALESLLLATGPLAAGGLTARPKAIALAAGSLAGRTLANRPGLLTDRPKALALSTWPIAAGPLAAAPEKKHHQKVDNYGYFPIVYRNLKAVFHCLY